MSTPDKPSRLAPLIVFGGILAIAVAGLTVVGVSECRREEPYLDPTMMAPDNPYRLDHRQRRGPGAPGVTPSGRDLPERQ